MGSIVPPLLRGVRGDLPGWINITNQPPATIAVLILIKYTYLLFPDSRFPIPDSRFPARSTIAIFN
ncbi:MAG: hypothetical protein F6K53_35700 [Moorea sp. SIO4A1]|uniref:hypothetical protein n=1 Tax=Moorena sp. SIO4A1 TaxID=2607835 RepID=UPI00144FABAF|nr:hypothetical protein [Moorena sp. SIO4A1]NEQ62451.1 hypothetical protein [Moorena sp. SIO4A1]